MTKESGSVRSDTGPFAIVPEWLLDSGVSGNGVKLYALLARYADDSTGRATPKRRTLAKRMGCSVDTVDRVLRELEGLGAIVREERFEEDVEVGTARQTTNTITVHRMRHPLGTDAEGSLGTDAEAPLGTDAQPKNENQDEREPTEREALAAVPAARTYDPLKGMKLEGRNLPWDALVEVTQADEKVEAGVLAKSLKQIRSFAASGFSPQVIDQAPENCEFLIAQQIRARARMYRERWPSMELTPGALAKNWSRVTTAPPQRPVSDLDRDYERMLGERQ